ncbi:endonuclease/exonuclease/phosphatase family protein [Sphingomonas sp.]|uniref:endonuclease/exonuclease/phosphatase family protein n=1 Tax=Sphingomonas sp. TaxID=28214 RepID=UPI0025F82B1D|nr:endonuclease/exonuclease/phosphatase family protein [Sphingomonas sp.]
MRIASFNVENLFSRAAALNKAEWVGQPNDNLAPWSAGRKALDAYSKLNALLAKPVYSAGDKADILTRLADLGLENRDESDLVILRRNRGSLLKRPVSGPVQVVANGRGDWIGWLELKKQAVNEVATQNTARVIDTVNADILVVIEAEDRTSLCRFDEQVLKAIGGAPYDHIMLIDGNDERGIDVGLFLRAPAEISLMRSHVDDAGPSGPLFSRDCPEYHIALPGGKRLCVLANHLKSKGYGTPAQSNARRKAQAKRVRQIYDGLRADGVDHIAVMGDFNDTLDSDPLSPLLGSGSDLKDVSSFPGFSDGGRKGTFGNCNASNKIDHILLSPALMAKVTAGGIELRGAWGGVHGTLWPHFPEITKASEAASDHAAIWVDLAI